MRALKGNPPRTKHAAFYLLEDDKRIEFYDGKEKIVFDNIQFFFEHILKRKYKSYRFYSHKAGTRDFLFILKYYFDSGFADFYNVDFLGVKEGGVISLKFKSKITAKKKENGDLKYYDLWELSDSFNLLPFTTKDLAKMYGLRCRGAKLLWHIIENFKNSKFVTGGNLKRTISSQALREFKRRFLKVGEFSLSNKSRKEGAKRIEILHGVEDTIRKSYYGGRCEIFNQLFESTSRNDKLYYYDINSAYPFAMCRPLPCGNPIFTTHYERDFKGFYNVEVSIPLDEKYPCIPKRTTNNRMIFPVGKFYTNLYTDELELGLKRGYKIKVIDGLVFPGTRYYFKDYVKYFYNLKQKSKQGTAEYKISKLFLNGLYGKFAQRRQMDSIIYETDFEKVCENKYTPLYYEYGLWVTKRISDSEDILPYISVAISSICRVLLAEYIDENTYYCDTDCIVTTKKKKTGKDIGDLKLEHTINRAIFLLPKIHIFETPKTKKIKFKGFPKEIFEKYDFEDFKKYLYQEKGYIKSKGVNNVFSFQKKRRTRFKESIRWKRDFTEIVEVKKRLSGKYDLRLTEKDNFGTIPIVLKEF